MLPRATIQSTNTSLHNHVKHWRHAHELHCRRNDSSRHSTGVQPHDHHQTEPRQLSPLSDAALPVPEKPAADGVHQQHSGATTTTTTQVAAIGTPRHVLIPEYTLWFQQDQLVMNAILSSLTDSVHAQVVGCNTAWEVWYAIKRAFAVSSRAQIIQI
jgi:hypothetical protein